MQIRSETPGDYAASAAVHAEAFAPRAIEAGIMTLHRQRAEFDPELSLVAELDGAVVGHALFSPRPVRLLGREVRAVCLGPIAVSPAHQSRKIGTALINAGHETARAKGYELSFLLGHPWYYPKLGYLTHAYGHSTIAVDPAGLPAGGLQQRAPLAGDVPALRRLWEHEEGGVDFAVDPGGALLDWLSPTGAVENSVFVSGEAVVGYARVRRDHPSRP
ncbi:MAG TPA: N-acetyltransferase, partial [Herpetosiphonaceae bacterium]